MVIGMLADAIADRLAARSTRPTHYAATHLPPGCPSWRAARERARAMGVPLVKVGRCVVIEAAAWTAGIERQTASASSATSTTTVHVSDTDAATLRALGVLS